MNLQYAVQPSPDGLVQAVIIGDKFLADDPSALGLSNNIFYGHDLQQLLGATGVRPGGATVFA